MAERKTRDLGPHTSQVAAPAKKQSKALDKKAFNNILRNLKTRELGSVNVIRNATFRKLRQLKVPRDLSKAVSGVPHGSDQGDWGSVIVWIQSVEAEDKDAIRQIVVIDATACKRNE